MPDSDSFVELAQLLGEDNELRVWWRAADDWRIDRIRSTGETDLFRNGPALIRWVFESEVATISPVSEIRLPDASDLLPPTLARLLLQGVRDEELSALPTRRVAGIDAAGVRLTPAERATSIAQVDIWADRRPGCRCGSSCPGPPTAARCWSPASATSAWPSRRGDHPVPAGRGRGHRLRGLGRRRRRGQRLSAYDLPTSLAGLDTRGGEDPGAVGVYGRGPTTLIVLPLRGQVAGPLRSGCGTAVARRRPPSAPWPRSGRSGCCSPRAPSQGALLLAGTVTAETLQRAAAELLGPREQPMSPTREGRR